MWSGIAPTTLQLFMNSSSLIYINLSLLAMITLLLLTRFCTTKILDLLKKMCECQKAMGKNGNRKRDIWELPIHSLYAPCYQEVKEFKDCKYNPDFPRVWPGFIQSFESLECLRICIIWMLESGVGSRRWTGHSRCNKHPNRHMQG